MKTTLDLPDDLVRRVKLRAVNENKKLTHFIAELLERALGAEQKSSPPPKPLRLRRGFTPTAEQIEAAIAEGRD